MKGRITKIIDSGKFFFIDNDYWCHFDKVNFSPVVFAEVEYEQSVDSRNGKKVALNVKSVGTSTPNSASHGSVFSNYLNELNNGYFESANYVKKEFIVDYAKELAQLFGRDKSINKSAQIRKYFDFCRRIEGIYKVKKDFNYVKSELPKLIYHINSAFNKKLVTREFCDFIEKNVELAIVSESNFMKGFICHFEAVIGFSNNN